MDDVNCGLFVPTPRPGSRTFEVVTGQHLLSRLTRVELTLDRVIEAELDDLLDGRDRSAGLGVDADAFPAAEDDRAVWEGGRLLAAIRPRAGGNPEVIRFDEGQPRLATDAERVAWDHVRGLGAEQAIERLCRPDRLEFEARASGQSSPTLPSPMTFAQEQAIGMIDRLGEDEATSRIFLTGHYEVIYDAILRLGTDAVAELRGVIATGKRDAAIIARVARALAGVDLARLAGIADDVTILGSADAEVVRSACSAIASACAILAEAG